MKVREDNGKNGQDSTEVDPCLTQKNERKPFYDRCLLRLQAKSGLSRFWVLVVGGLALFSVFSLTVIVSLSAAWPQLPHMFRHSLCHSPQCLRAAAQIRENLDSSVSPCADPWLAMCSSYVKSATPPLDRPVWNQKEALMLEELERIRNVVSTFELPLHTGTIEWKMKHFYEACMDVDTIAMDGSRPLSNIISELGGWYILRDWNEDDFNGMQVLTKLQVRYGVSPFFRVHVEPNPMVPGTNAIRISPAGLGLPDKEFYFRDSDDKVVNAYTDFIRDVVISLSSTRNEAAKFGKDIFNYEKRLAEVTPDSVFLQDPVETYSSVALDELRLRVNTIPFFDILQEMYPEIAVTESTEVLVTSEKYLSQLAQIISSTDRHMLNGYLIWTLVRSYLPYMSEKYTSSMDSFNFELFGTSKMRKRWEVCAGLLRDFMPLATEYHLERAYPLHRDALKSVNKTFKTILSTVRKKVNTFKDTVWLVPHVNSKLDGLRVQLGLPESTKSSQFLKEFYAPLKILKLNWFEGVKSAVGLRRRIEERMLLNGLPEGMLFVAPPRVVNVPSMNTVIVPRSLVMEPYSDSGYPRPILYGRLGTGIAAAIISAVLPHDSLWTSDRKLLSPFHKTVNETAESVRPSSVCLSKKIPVEAIPRPFIEEAALKIVKQLAAVRVANEAMLARSLVEAHTHYSGLEQYEETALFFISYAQTVCGIVTPQYSAYETVVNFAVSPRLQLDLIWTESPEFRMAFDCPDPRTQNECFTVF